MLMGLKAACEELVAIHTAEIAAITRGDVGELVALQQRLTDGRRNRTTLFNALRRHMLAHGC